MLNETRVYKYSILRLVLLILMLLLLGVMPIVILGSVKLPYIFYTFVFVGLLILFSVYTLTRSTTISNDGISTRSLLGESSLNWNEIDSVSGSGNGIKLRNRDGDVTVSPSPQLPGYPEVIEMIGAKRLDLFKPTNFGVLRRNWLKSLVFLIALVLIIGIALYLYRKSSDTVISLIFIIVIALGFIASIFLSVLAIRVDGSQLTIRYLLSQLVLKPEDVHSIALNVMQTRNGKSYSVVLFTRNNKMIRFSGIGPSLPVTYLVLKNWHQTSARA